MLASAQFSLGYLWTLINIRTNHLYFVPIWIYQTNMLLYFNIYFNIHFNIYFNIYLNIYILTYILTYIYFNIYFNTYLFAVPRGASGVLRRARRPQPDLHRHVHRRVRPQDILLWTQGDQILLQKVSSFWFCCILQTVSCPLIMLILMVSEHMWGASLLFTDVHC